MSAADQYRLRVLADMFNETLATQWEHRARVFEWAAPRPSDFRGRATPAELDARSKRCRQTAEACRAKAAVLRRYGMPDFIAAELAEQWREVAA